MGCRRYVRKRKGDINPNPGFKKELKEYEKVRTFFPLVFALESYDAFSLFSEMVPWFVVCL